MSGSVNTNRRNLLRGVPVSTSTPVRPPGAVDEQAFLDGCTACDECVNACPEGIIISGSGGYPEVDFRRGECTFCSACIDHCPEAVLSPSTNPLWQLRLVVRDRCLAKRRVVCQSCGDVCDQRAIRFRPRIGDVAIPEVQHENCNGCGACVSACPDDALALETFPSEYSVEGADFNART